MIGIWQFNLHILNGLSKLYFVTALEEQSLSHANMLRHTSGGYNLGEKKEKKNAGPFWKFDSLQEGV